MSSTRARAGRPALLAHSLAALATLFLAACEGGGTSPRFALEIETTGFVERGGTAAVQVKLDGETIPMGEVQLTANPSDAVTVVAPGTLRFLRAGTVTITAEARGNRGTRNLEIGPPPTVVFDRVANGNRDLWTVAMDGGELARLSDHASDDLDPTVAQGQVVFVSYRGGSADLWRMPLSGGEAVRLTQTPQSETMPALSPDRTRLAYAFDTTGVPKLRSAAADGSGAARATEGFGFDGSLEASPSWAPTGPRLVFTATSAGTADLYILTLPGTPVLFEGGSGAQVEPAWSPDGGRIAYASNHTGDTELYLKDVTTGAVTRLTTRAGADGQPAWTADGRIVFTQFVSGGSRLAWLDPAAPDAVHVIDTGAGPARSPAPVR